MLPTPKHQTFQLIAIGALILLAGHSMRAWGQTTPWENSVLNRSQDAGYNDFGAQTFESYLRAGWWTLDGTENTPDYFRIAFTMRFQASAWSGALDMGLSLEEPLQVRAQQWDEASDFIRWITFIEFSGKKTGRFFRIGQLSGDDARLGFGHIIGGYNTDADLDSPLLGLQADWDWGSVGFETFVNDITAWNVLGMRLYTRPLYEDAAAPWDWLMLGGTVVVDRLAANRWLDRNNDGRGDITSGQNPRYHATWTTVLGADVSFPLVVSHRQYSSLYAEAVQMIDHGHGFFLGVEGTWAVPYQILERVSLAAEYQVVSKDFLGPYFDALYEVERFAYPTLDAETTRLTYLQNVDGASGVMLRGRATKQGMGWVTVAYWWYDRDKQWARGRFLMEISTDDTSPFLPFNLTVRYLRRAPDHGGVFAFDDRTVLTGTLNLPIYRGIGLAATWLHGFRYDRTDGDFHGADTFGVSLSYNTNW